ncbi:hypothetical protein [Rhodococcus marinonascens]|nr:hypothetical protein [Rhodococcus marinonascens]
MLYTAAIAQKRWHPAAQKLLARHEPDEGARSASFSAISSMSFTVQ